MEIVVSEIEYCKVNIHYEADPETVAAKRGEVLDKFKGAVVPGFRKNHASPEALKIYFKKEINDALKKELANDAVQNVMHEKNIKPFGYPSFQSLVLDGSKFSCDFMLHTQPEFDLKEYKDFEIPKFSKQMTSDELAQKILQDLRVRYGNTTPYSENDFIQNGDNVVIDYSGSVDGNLIERLNAKGELIIIGKTPIPGFDDNLLGLKIGDEKSFSIKMPEDISDSLANKSIDFQVKIILGSKVEPAALDDNLAKKIGFPDFQAMLNQANGTASNRIKELERNHVLDQISRRLVSTHEFKIPSWISSSEAQINAKNNGENWEVLSDVQKEKYVEHAENSIKLSLILNKVRDNEPDAQLSDEEVFKSARENIMKFSEKPDEVLENVVKNGHLPILFNRIKDEHTLSFIEKNCKIVE